LKILNITRKGKTPQYRGAIQILTEPKSKRLTVINQLSLQDYLRAVVPNELPIRFGIEAVKAQAVAARNYALRPREKNWHAFDICDSQLCQAYYGRQTETPETDAMLENTEGQVLLHDGQIALALYSSSHGGVSTNYHNAFSHPVTQAFPAPALRYLQSVWDDSSVQARFNDLSDEATLLAYLKTNDLPSFDRKSPHFRWQVRLTYAQLTENIQRNLPKLLTRSSTARWIKRSPDFNLSGEVNRLESLQRDSSGKLMSLKIHTTQGFLVVQKEFVIRSLLRSPNRFFLSATIAFEPYVDESGKDVGITIYGTGFGHGVGMSQFGASGMNDEGFLYPTILAHYYPYTTLGTPPLTLQAGYAQRQKVHGVKGSQAILHLQVPEGKKLEQPFVFKVNEVTLRVQPFLEKERMFNITSYLNLEALNHFHWSPYEVPLKAWISFEAHPPSS
jgi:SpoIID/LytB domain protein